VHVATLTLALLLQWPDLPAPPPTVEGVCVGNCSPPPVVNQPQSVDPATLELQAGLDAAQRGDWNAAAAAFRSLLARDPNRADAHFHLGVALRNLRQWEEARASLQQALRLDPANSAARDVLLQVDAEQQAAREAEVRGASLQRASGYREEARALRAENDAEPLKREEADAAARERLRLSREQLQLETGPAARQLERAFVQGHEAEKRGSSLEAAQAAGKGFDTDTATPPVPLIVTPGSSGLPPPARNEPPEIQSLRAEHAELLKSLQSLEDQEKTTTDWRRRIELQQQIGATRSQVRVVEIKVQDLSANLERKRRNPARRPAEPPPPPSP
jgi:tetratricopeptide (TPR) repeat protein